MIYEVQLKNVSKHFGNFKAPDNVIFIGGRRVNDLPPGERGIGFLFQSYALFRHMTVFENIAFGLRVKKMPEAEFTARVEELAELISLKDFTRRYPMQLSGGQRQRVAFARALAPNPELLLLDEPFAAIDAKVRQELRGWLKQTIHKLGITSIFVTHDQDEAVEVADEIIITNRGRIEQAGVPVEIYQTPKTPFVAKFIGDSVHLDNVSRLRGFNSNAEGILRPEFIDIGASESEMPLPRSAEIGTVRAIYFHGSSVQVEIDLNGLILKGYRSLEKAPLHEGDKAYVFVHRVYTFDGDATHVLENFAKRREPVII